MAPILDRSSASKTLVRIDLPHSGLPFWGGPLCFWHPVGAHAGETLDKIVRRKRREIEKHGYTLWSFAPARLERVSSWRAQLERHRQRQITAVCCGDSTRDPGQNMVPYWATEHSVDLGHWSKVPSRRMTSYHRRSTSDRPMASAFVVMGIESPTDLVVRTPSKWYRTSEDIWEKEQTLPTRGEYLVDNLNVAPNGRRVRLLLRISEPFVVWIR